MTRKFAEKSRIQEGNIWVGLCLLLVAVVFSGCAATNPLPMAARAGDTITLAVGSAEGMTTNNTTVTFTPVDTTIAPSTLPIKNIFNVYPDREATDYWTGVGTGSGWLQFATGGAEHSPWLTVVVIDLPSGLMNGGSGDGIITVATAATYGTEPGYDINGKQIYFTVLPGVGQSHPLQYSVFSSMPGNLHKLEKAHRIVVSANSDDAVTLFGAVELRLQFGADGPGSGPQKKNFYVVPEDLQFKTKSMRQVSWSVQEGNVLLVTFLSPIGALVPTELQFSIIPSNTVAVSSPMPATFPNDPSLISATYYDVDGNVISGPTVG